MRTVKCPVCKVEHDIWYLITQDRIWCVCGVWLLVRHPHAKITTLTPCPSPVTKEDAG